MKRLYWAVLVFFLLVVIANGWMIDDAYITFRTVDNFLNGHGLRWNVDERVQAYTHPLWMLLMSAASLLTGELYFTSLAVSFACSLAAVGIAAGTVSRDAPWKAPLLLLALLCSKAMIDYTSSGLETPLAYLIAALFLKFMLEDRADQTKLTVAALCASLTFITRPDSVVLYLPAIIYLTWRTGRVRPLLAASLPAAAWMLFSLIYYGFPFPNTAYAKQLGTSFPSSWIVWRGLEYAGNSLLWETAAYALLVLATVLAARQRTARLVIAGVLSYIALVVLRLGSNHPHERTPLRDPDVRGNRDVRAPAQPEAARDRDSRAAERVLRLESGVTGQVRHPRLRATRTVLELSGHQVLRVQGRHRVAQLATRTAAPGSSVVSLRRGHESQPETGVRGCLQRRADRICGYAAGPDKFIIDLVALSDPLLARLPAKRPRRTKTGNRDTSGVRSPRATSTRSSTAAT